MVDVVQLVEHRIVVPSVVGSSPIIHPCCNSRTNPRVAFLLGACNYLIFQQLEKRVEGGDAVEISY